MKSLPFCFNLILFLLALHSFGQPKPSVSQQLNALFEAYDEEYLQLFPLHASFRGDSRYNDQLQNEISREHRTKQRALYSKYLQQAVRFKQKDLLPKDRLHYQVFVYLLEKNLAYLSFDSHLRPVDQTMWSRQLFFAQLGGGKSIHPFKTTRDYEDFLARVKDYETWTDTAIANMREGMAKGVVQPKAVMEKVLPQLEALLAKNIKESEFYSPVLNMPQSFSTEERNRLTIAFEQAIEKQILPAYRRLHDFIQEEYLPRCRSSYGLAAIPGGKAQYAFLVQYQTTTTQTPEQLFQTGLQEVKRIRSQMEKVKQETGFNGTLTEFFKYLNSDPKFFPYKTEAQILQAYQEIHTQLQAQVGQLFSLEPKIGFEIRQTEKYRAADAVPSYMAPSADGSRPGVFYVPILEPSKYKYYEMENFFLHEAIPGHHFQAAYKLEQKHLPNFLQYGDFIAFSEGWGLYAESLGKALGLYQDPYQYMGRLGGEMHRALRLVLDVGIHQKGWSREEAIKFSLENSPFSAQFNTTEVERYMARPAQALAYKTGELKILELRSKAEQALGSKFDIRAFHAQVLQDGSLPLAVLEAKIDGWVKTQTRTAQAQTGNN